MEKSKWIVILTAFQRLNLTAIRILTLKIKEFNLETTEISSASLTKNPVPQISIKQLMNQMILTLDRAQKIFLKKCKWITLMLHRSYLSKLMNHNRIILKAKSIIQLKNSALIQAFLYKNKKLMELYKEAILN